MQERLRMHQGEMRHYRHLRHVTCATEHYQQTTALLTWSIQATGRPKTVGKRTLRDLLKRVFLHQTWVIKKTDRLPGKQTAYWVDMHTTQKKLPHPSYRSGSLVETQGLSPILAEPLTGEFLRLAKRTPSPQESTSAPTLGFRQQREAICSKRSCSTLVLRRARLSNWTTSLALRPCYAFGVFILRAHLHTWFEAMWCTHILWGVFADIPVFEHVHFLLSVYKVLIRRFPSWQ